MPRDYASISPFAWPGFGVSRRNAPLSVHPRNESRLAPVSSKAVAIVQHPVLISPLPPCLRNQMGGCVIF
jgi:hypothetical protein